MPKKTIDILGVGNAIMDVIAPMDDKFLKTNKITRNAMELIDESRAVALTGAFNAVHEDKSAIKEVAGGSAANTIVGASLLGTKTAYFGKVGKDEMGKRFKAGLEESDVEFKTRPLKDGATARCLIAVSDNGDRSMNTFLGASTEFASKDIKKETIEAAKLVYLEGYLFDKEPAKKAYDKATKLAKEAGCEIALTLSDSFCVDRHRDDFKKLIESKIDILFANEDELLSLTEMDDFDAAIKAVGSHDVVTCITRGENGSVIMDGEDYYTIEAMPVDKVVDTTGAGDQYAAGVLAARAKGLDWADAGRLGSICAAEVISHYGARPERDLKAFAAGCGIDLG